MFKKNSKIAFSNLIFKYSSIYTNVVASKLKNVF